MKGMIVTGLMVGCLALGLMAQFNNAWLTEEEDDVTTNMGLTNREMIGEFGSDAECDANAAGTEAAFPDADVECDGKEMTMTISIEDLCDHAMTKADPDAEDDCNDSASAGSTGGMILWVGSIAAILASVLLILGIAGVEVDAIPDNVGMIMNWAAGGLTILAVLVWYMMLPDGGDMSASTGVYMGVIGGVLGLAAGGMDTFMAADDDGGGDAAPAE